MRELEHVISRAALKELSRGTSRALIITLEPQVLDLDSAMGTQSVVAEQPQEEPNDLPFQALSDAVDECQRQKILHSLRLADDNWARAARMLEVDASNLHKLARRLGLK